MSNRSIVRPTATNVGVRTYLGRSLATGPLFAALLLAALQPCEGVTVGWTRRYDASFEDRSTDVSVDGLGNIALSGFTSGSLAGPHEGFADAFAIKLDSLGNVLWSRQIGTNRSEYGEAIDHGPNGEVYVAGSTSGSLAGTNAGQSDIFLTVFNSDGAPSWTRQLGTNQVESARGVAVGQNGSIYVAGTTRGNLGGQFNSANEDAFVAKYDQQSNLLWTRLAGTMQDDRGSEVAVGVEGAVYLVGTTFGELVAGSGGSDYDAFIRKYDADGNVGWTRQFGTAKGDSALGVATDSFGNIYVSGLTQGDLGSSHLGSDDAFLRKYSPDGQIQWTRQFGAGTDRVDAANAVAIDNGGNAYVTGLMWNDDYMREELYARKYDAHGGLVWEFLLGPQQGLGIATDHNGGIFVAGGIGSDALVIKLTDIAGDYTGDGIVDGADFLYWQRQYGQTEGGPYHGADGSGNRIVNDADLASWVTGISVGSEADAVPEHSSLAIAALTILGLAPFGRLLILR